MRLEHPARRARSPIGVALCLAGSIGAAVVSAGASGPTPAPSSSGRGAPTITLRLLLASPLPDDIRAVMQAEVDAIWRHEGYAVRWTDPSSQDTPPPDVLRVAILDHDRMPVRARAERPVAELVIDDSHRAWALTSLDGARRVVRAAINDVEPQLLEQRRLGLVLGRALAHEIGHYLLATSHHTNVGLMRARIDPRELVALQRAAMWLDAATSRRLRVASARKDARAVAAGSKVDTAP